MQHFLREPVNGLTHCIGALLAVVGLVVLVLEASNPPRPWHITTYSVFGVGMILLYTVSTLYHWLTLSESALARLRKLDHMMIFILIAATYTPLCLIPLRGSLGWSLFGSIWAIAIFGIIFKLFWIQAPRWISAGVYVFMGWLALAGIGPIVNTLQPGAVFWLFAGGLFYSVGALIYALKRPDPLPNVFGFHEIFHIFVLLGSLSHFWTIYRYVSAFS
ncbi:MAG: hemolysin III family protein [Desulfomonilia bacterium]|nr:hemolysin III family protein [Desulfomonilia bacterium]